MNARDALTIIEYAVEYYVAPRKVTDALATLSAALAERDALLTACKLVEPAIDSILTEFISKEKSTDWELVNDCLCLAAAAIAKEDTL